MGFQAQLEVQLETAWIDVLAFEFQETHMLRDLQVSLTPSVLAPFEKETRVASPMILVSDPGRALTLATLASSSSK